MKDLLKKKEKLLAKHGYLKEENRDCYSQRWFAYPEFQSITFDFVRLVSYDSLKHHLDSRIVK